MEHFHSLPLSHSATSARYATWVREAHPRTCLLIHWLHTLGAVPDPGPRAHDMARQLANKRSLIGRLIDRADDQTCDKTVWLLDHGDFDVYVAYLMWLRFHEYVPRPFVLPHGRARVLAWVRSQLRRPELSDSETIRELHWRIETIHEGWSEPDSLGALHDEF